MNLESMVIVKIFFKTFSFFSCVLTRPGLGLIAIAHSMGLIIAKSNPTKLIMAF